VTSVRKEMQAEALGVEAGDVLASVGGEAETPEADKRWPGHLATTARCLDRSRLQIVRGLDDAHKAWYVVSVDESKADSFKAALGNDRIELKAYGSIVMSAYGELSHDEICERLEKSGFFLFG